MRGLPRLNSFEWSGRVGLNREWIDSAVRNSIVREHLNYGFFDYRARRLMDAFRLTRRTSSQFEDGRCAHVVQSIEFLAFAFEASRQPGNNQTAHAKCTNQRGCHVSLTQRKLRHNWDGANRTHSKCREGVVSRTHENESQNVRISRLWRPRLQGQYFQDDRTMGPAEYREQECGPLGLLLHNTRDQIFFKLTACVESRDWENGMSKPWWFASCSDVMTDCDVDPIRVEAILKIELPHSDIVSKALEDYHLRQMEHDTFWTRIEKFRYNRGQL